MHSPSASRKPRIGLALGGGSARGWAHVGVIRALEEAGIHPHIVCGSSVGALVGAAYAAGELDRFEEWLLDMGIRDMMSLVDVSLAGGVLKGEKLMEFFRRKFNDRPIEELDLPFGAVATALHSGAEVWLREGSTLDAVRASIALPALFTPVLRDGVMLVDGGLVNPVPVSLARAMGAEVVIAVDLSADILGRHLRDDAEGAGAAGPSGGLPDGPATNPSGSGSTNASDNVLGEWLQKLQQNLGELLPDAVREARALPSLIEVVASSLNIMQVRITRSRMAGDPPDLIVTPRLAHLGLFEFHRASEAIDEGRRAVAAVLHHLRLPGH